LIIIIALGPISCTTSGNVITITNFADFSPQYVEIKIWAYNPATAKTYSPFQITTYSKFGDKTATSYSSIDANYNAGEITISDIDSPYFTAVDLFKKMVNSTLLQTNPLDYRFYPKRGK
jgi:hypothetical protein